MSMMNELKRLEWKGTYSYCTGWPACPMCGGMKPGVGKDEDGNLPIGQGHRPGCALDAIIRRYEEPTEAMLEAGGKALAKAPLRMSNRYTARACFKAMIEAEDASHE